MLRTLLSAMGVFALLVVTYCGWILWNFNQPPFELSRLERLQPGMSQQDVRQILGNPQSQSPGTWSYARTMSWPIVKVHFDKNDRYTTSEYDF